MRQAQRRLIDNVIAALLVGLPLYLRDMAEEQKAEGRRAGNKRAGGGGKPAPAPRETRIVSAKSRPSPDAKQCRAPWCRKQGAARHGMFCVERHKDLPASTKKLYTEKWRAKRRED
jgi:hypothetical protein